MNLNGRERNIESEVALKENMLLNNFLFKDEKTARKYFLDVTDEILKDEDYQKEAIKILKDKNESIFLKGVISSIILLQNYSIINPKIIRKLLDNIFLVEENNSILEYRFLGIPYIKYILDMQSFYLPDKYHKKILQQIKLPLADKSDIDLLVSFFIKKGISIELKKEVVESMSFNDIEFFTTVWYEEKLYEMFVVYNLANNIDFKNIINLILEM